MSVRSQRIQHGWAATTRPGIAFRDVPNAGLRVRIAGTRAPGAPAIVMVCDPPNVIEHFDRLFELIAPDHRLIVVEPPGFGFSCPKRGFRFSFDDYLASFEALLQSLDEGPYVLAFTCVWGHIAMQLAARHPALIAKLMLWQCPAWAQQVRWAHHVDPKRVLVRPVIGQVMTAWGAEKVGVSWYRRAMAKDRYRDFTPTLREALGHGSFCCLGSLWQQWFEGFTPAPVAVQQPTLVSWGDADRTHAHSDPRSLAQQLTHATWHSFATAGHSPELEAPDEYVKLLRDFIAEAAR